MGLELEMGMELEPLELEREGLCDLGMLHVAMLLVVKMVVNVWSREEGGGQVLSGVARDLRPTVPTRVIGWWAGSMPRHLLKHVSGVA